MTSPSFFGASSRLLALSLLASASISLPAAVITWGGSTGEYTTAGNWTGGLLPNTNSGDTALITAGAVTYTPGGDLTLHNGGKLQISGGSWTQVDSVAWIQMAGGSIVVDGGTFNQGTAGNLVLDSSSSISISSGAANFNGNFIYQPTNSGTFSITGGTVSVANEFKPIETFTMSGGSLTATLISFADGTGGVNLAGGTITLDGSGGNHGFYGGDANKGLNFTSAAGTLFLSSFTISELTTAGFLTNGTIQYNGTVDSSKFNLSEADGGVYVTAVGSAIPEPSTAAALFGLIVLGAACNRRRRSRA